MDEMRRERLAHRIVEELSSLLMRGEIKDPRVNTFFSFSHCRVAKDGTSARIGVSTFLDHSTLDRAVEGFNSASGYLQSRLGKALRVRTTPRLYFVADHSIEEGHEVIQKINELSHGDDG
jgi:ribosome-binding factor A